MVTIYNYTNNARTHERQALSYDVGWTLHFPHWYVKKFLHSHLDATLQGRVVATQLNKTVYLHHPFLFPLGWIIVQQPSIYIFTIFVDDRATPFKSTPLQPWSVQLSPSHFVICSLSIPICPFLQQLTATQLNQLFVFNGTHKWIAAHKLKPYFQSISLILWNDWLLFSFCLSVSCAIFVFHDPPLVGK